MNGLSEEYLHHVAQLLVRGRSAALPIEAETEESANVVSIEAARTRRAIDVMMRRRAAL